MFTALIHIHTISIETLWFWYKCASVFNKSFVTISVVKIENIFYFKTDWFNAGLQHKGLWAYHWLKRDYRNRMVIYFRVPNYLPGILYVVLYSALLSHSKSNIQNEFINHYACFSCRDHHKQTGLTQASQAEDKSGNDEINTWLSTRDASGHPRMTSSRDNNIMHIAKFAIGQNVMRRNKLVKFCT